MDKINTKPKKSLGQNFLQDRNTLLEIIKAGKLNKNNNVLEIGPGTGFLTRELIKKSNKVIAIEKDEKLAQEINTRLNNENNLVIVSGDVLKVNLSKLIEENNFYNYKIIANIPYYITGKILRILLETKYKPSLLVFLVQKEVAKRICSRKGNLSILGIAVQFYGEPEIVSIVKRDKFHPIPKVDSAILKIRIKKSEELICKTPETINDFFKTVKIGFSSPRKILLNNLANGFNKDKKEIKEVFKRLKIKENSRAQDLELIQWKMLAEELK